MRLKRKPSLPYEAEEAGIVVMGMFVEAPREEILTVVRTGGKLHAELRDQLRSHC